LNEENEVLFIGKEFDLGSLASGNCHD